MTIDRLFEHSKRDIEKYSQLYNCTIRESYIDFLNEAPIPSELMNKLDSWVAAKDSN